MTTDQIIKINKDVFINVGTTALTAVVFDIFPFLLVPPLKMITSKVCKIIVTQMALKAELGAFFLYTDFRVDKQGNAYVASVRAVDEEIDPVRAEQLRVIADAKFKDFFKLNR